MPKDLPDQVIRVIVPKLEMGLRKLGSRSTRFSRMVIRRSSPAVLCGMRSDKHCDKAGFPDKWVLGATRPACGLIV